jgi:hypothetical protein
MTRPNGDNFKPRVRNLGGRRYLIESRTKPGLGHVWNALTGSCSCKAGQHGRTCWHEAYGRGADATYQRLEREAQRVYRPRGIAALQEAFG